MAEVRWIKLNVGMFDGNSFKKIKKAKIGGESFRDKLTAVWFELMDFAGKCNAGGQLIENPEIPFSSIEDIAILIDREPEELNLCMQYYINNRMITVIDDVLMLTNWAKYQNEDGLEKIREQNRIRQQRWYEKQKALPNVRSNVSITQPNGTDIDIDIETEEDKKLIGASGNAQGKEPDVPKVSRDDIEKFFETIWKLYPNKKGKGQISDAKKKALYNIGIEEMTRAIERYKSDLAKEDWRVPQNGSTFFNSGHVDYLDANYEPLKAQPQKSTNKFNNFQQREYTDEQWKEMERKLLGL